MIAYEASLTYQLCHFDAEDPLTTTKQLLSYLTKNVPETDDETFWILTMNPKRRPICRHRLARGPLVAVQVGVTKVFLSIALAEAKSFICLRTQPSGSVNPTLADGRLAWRLNEMSKLCHVEFVDYLIARLDNGAYHSWRESERRAA